MSVFLMNTAGILVVLAPFALVLLLGVSSLMGVTLAERRINQAVLAMILGGLLASVVVLGLMLALGERHVVLDLGVWVEAEHFHVLVKFVFDRLSVPFAILSFLLSGTVAAFATRYMHREGGYNRFFVLYSVFVLGMIVASLADTIETLFIGWELVGLSSALLVAFFQERAAPSRNGLWLWSIYRVSDAALLLAAVVLHHLTGEGDFDLLLGGQSWPEGRAILSEGQALAVGLLLLIAAAGKSGLIPFSGWLPRAMEGPTPSSAVFYGALSVHLGAFLLLRASPILECSIVLCVLVVVLGLATSLLASLMGNVQTDIKSALSFASLTQVGLIVAEIGLGLRYVALIHLLGHACLRTLQFVRAPSLLHDYHTLENALGEHLSASLQPPSRVKKETIRLWIYRLGLERGYLDAWIKRFFVDPFIHLFRNCDAAERRWTEFLTGNAAPVKGTVDPFPRKIEELL
jgi:NAD(P)H-quinone oxidoreductase subunit 5